MTEEQQRQPGQRGEPEQRQQPQIHPPAPGQGDTPVHQGVGPLGQECKACDQAEDLDIVVAPVGGGGLLSGTAVTVSALRGEKTTLWGAEPKAVDDAYRSLESGELQPGVAQPQSWGDGLLTGLGCNPFTLLKERGVRVITVSEEAMLDAAWMLISRLKTVVEPSAGVSFAAAIKQREAWAGKRVGVILSGGNTDFRWLEEIG